jgi:AraC-like DNA-binding protein
MSFRSIKYLSHQDRQCTGLGQGDPSLSDNQACAVADIACSVLFFRFFGHTTHMHENRTNQKELPVIRLMLALPFLDAARQVGVDADAELLPFGLNSLAFDNPDMFVPAATMYDIVETLGDATGDPYIGAKLGLQLNFQDWPPFINAAKQSQSVGDFLLRFCIDAYRDANSVVFQLQTRGSRTTFQETRVSDGARKPRHNDAFGTGYILQIIRGAVGNNWDGREVIAKVYDPSAIPADFCGIRVAATDRSGFAVSFPCEWLLLKPSLIATGFAGETSIPNQPAPESILEALRHVLDSNLDDPQLDSARVAQLCGLSLRTLSRKLAKADTTLNRELAFLRRQRAQTYLTNSDMSIREISLKVGYSDPAVFTRAFRRWAGTTPTKYRSSS